MTSLRATNDALSAFRARPMTRISGEDAAGSSGRTDYPEMAASEDAFERLKSAAGSVEVERARKPYAPLREGETIPSMQKLWAHAMRRYGRYQGYAWVGVIATGALAFGLASATREDTRGEKEGPTGG